MVAPELQKTLLNTVSHNLRTPLASIAGILDGLIEDRGEFDESTRLELLRSAREQADRLRRLIGNLLDMTRLEGGGIQLITEPWDVRDVIDAALLHLGDPAARQFVSLSIEPGLPAISVDCTLIAQSIVNILDNAFKYAGEKRPIEIRAWRHGGVVRVAIADDGEGFAPQDLPRVFDKFYSASARSGGMGLGLSICKGLVEAHGGSIWAENGEHGGAVITFSLPIHDQAGGR
jgi:two-component system sensor histidine kinase KdpD